MDGSFHRGMFDIKYHSTRTGQAKMLAGVPPGV